MLIAAKYILSDAIVVWRAWVVWGPSRRFTVFTPPILSLVCTLGQYKQTVGWLSRLTGPSVSIVGRWRCIRVPQ